MIVLEIMSWAVFGIALLAAVLFGIGCGRERQWRALVATSLLGIAGLSPLAVVLLMDFPGRDWMLLVMMGLAVLGILLLVVPYGRVGQVRVVGQQTRVDERDAVFHRFYRLEPGTQEHRSYYDLHPEKVDFDERINSMPALAEPGSKTFDKVTSRYQSALYSQVEHVNKFLDDELEQLGKPRLECSGQVLTEKLKGFAKYLGADLVGCTKLNQTYVYSHIGRSPGEFGASIDYSHHTHALVIAVRMSHTMMRQAPFSAATTETSFRYLQIANMAMVLARYINLLGYSARAHVDGNYRLMCVPIAVDAGLGELGRLGLLVTQKFGPRVRLAVVSTDLPLEQDEPRAFGVQEFCEICAKCATNCPSGSVDKGKKGQYRGVEKWKTEMDTCYRTWRLLGSDCGVCVKVCPYSHPDTFMHNLVRFAISRDPLSRKLMLLGDEIFYGKKPADRPSVVHWHRPGSCAD